MSKKSMSRAAKLKKQRIEAAKAAHKARVRKIRIVSAIVTASVLLAVIMTAAIAVAVYNKRLNDGDYLREKIAAASKNYDVSGTEMSYFFNDTYNTFLSYYGSYVQYFGIDTDTSLKSQSYTDGESWFDYFMSGSRTTVERVLALNEAAAADGVSLTDAEIAAMEARCDAVDEGMYGRGVNTEDIYAAKSLEALAYKYQFEKEHSLEPADEEVLSYFESDSSAYQLVDYYAFEIYYADGDSDSTLPEAEEAALLAEGLAEAQSEEEFRVACGDILISEDGELTEEEISQKLDSMELTEQYYSADSEISEWAFGSEEGSTYIITDEENSTITVYYLSSAPYVDRSVTVSARHILFSDSTYGSREAAMEAAERVLEMFNSGDMTSDAFALLALEYSEDAGSYYNGGLYESMYAGQMVDSFDSWCFDESREHGDTGIIETDYGCHIMYFESESYERWESDVRYDMVNERFDAYLEEIMEKYPVLFDENVIDMIPG